MDVVVALWSRPCHAPNSAALISRKLKNLRYELSKCGKGISRLTILIQNINKSLAEMDQLEDKRSLYVQEVNLELF